MLHRLTGVAGSHVRRLGVFGFGVFAAAVPGLTGAIENVPTDREQTRSTMRRIFSDVQLLLPLSVDDAAFAAPENRERIRIALTDLAGRADRLAGHGNRDQVRFAHLGGSLARDARDALRTWQSGHPEHAQFLVRQLTENCIACHASLPSPGDSPLAAGFVDEAVLEGLSPIERTSLLIATRRFEKALVGFESLLASPEFHPAELLGPLTDYLTVALRVKRDPKRPIPVLERFAKRKDLWRYLRLDVEHWTRSLRQIGGKVTTAPDLASARSLLEEARSSIRFPADRRGLVHYIVASSQLHRLIAERPDSDPDVAEACYLLGLIESRIGRNEWVSQAGIYLETSIRLQPHSSFAEEAYATLEEETLLDYGSALGEAIPEDVARNLAELRALIDADAKGAAATP